MKNRYIKKVKVILLYISGFGSLQPLHFLTQKVLVLCVFEIMKQDV